MALAQRKMDIALVRGMNKEEIMSHDLFDDSILSNFSWTTTKINKSVTVAETERCLLSTTAVIKMIQLYPLTK